MKTYFKLLLLTVLVGPSLALAKSSLTCESVHNTPDYKSYPIFVLYYDLDDPDAEAELWKEQESQGSEVPGETYWVGISVQSPTLDGEMLTTDNDFGENGRILIQTWGPGPGESRLILQLRDTGFFFPEERLRDYICH